MDRRRARRRYHSCGHPLPERLYAGRPRHQQAELEESIAKMGIKTRTVSMKLRIWPPAANASSRHRVTEARS